MASDTPQKSESLPLSEGIYLYESIKTRNSLSPANRPFGLAARDSGMAGTSDVEPGIGCSHEQ